MFYHIKKNKETFALTTFCNSFSKYIHLNPKARLSGDTGKIKRSGLIVNRQMNQKESREHNKSPKRQEKGHNRQVNKTKKVWTTNGCGTKDNLAGKWTTINATGEVETGV